MSKCHITRDLLPNHQLIAGARGLFWENRCKLTRSLSAQLIKSSFLRVLYAPGPKATLGSGEADKGSPLAKRETLVSQPGRHNADTRWQKKACSAAYLASLGPSVHTHVYICFE
jgi:hypothetical protein